MKGRVRNDPAFLSIGYINPARNGGVFYLIFKISGGYIESDFV